MKCISNVAWLLSSSSLNYHVKVQPLPSLSTLANLLYLGLHMHFSVYSTSSSPRSLNHHLQLQTIPSPKMQLRLLNLSHHVNSSVCCISIFQFASLPFPSTACIISKYTSKCIAKFCFISKCSQLCFQVYTSIFTLLLAAYAHLSILKRDLYMYIWQYLSTICCLINCIDIYRVTVIDNICHIIL